MPNCWIEIKLSAIRDNFRAVRDLVGEETGVIAVIKANAYGCGAIEVARALAAEGARSLAVTRVEEAIPLRQAGIGAPILMLAPAPEEDVAALVEHQLIACISDRIDAERLSREATRQSTLAHCQMKINSGMGRLGIEAEDALDVAKEIVAMPNVQLEAAWTHFADAGERKARQVSFQYGKFQPLIHHLSRTIKASPRDFHCANSAALVRFPSLRLSCVRTGTLLYGQFPSPPVAEAGAQFGLKLTDPFAAKARIIAIKALYPGQTVGYGAEWTATRPSRIATIGIGFADGLTQTPNTRQTPAPVALARNARDTAKSLKDLVASSDFDPARKVHVRGQEAYIIGRIAMQSCSIDITHLPEVELGDEVKVPMRRTSAGAHLPRIYV
ncbi:MAG: alanine racemase [Abditibacteriota bacterium]|nr:alanine racemase [Abditibacteriota bacterium]